MSMMDFVGQTIGQYRIEGSLDAGGMGQVFRGIHIYLNRPAAIKVMRPHLVADEKFRTRFLQEAQAAAALKHPNIVDLYEFGEQSGHLYMVMELVTGGSLRSLLQQQGGQPLSLALGLDLVRQAAEGLAIAHDKGIVHRDIKPDNLLLNRLNNSEDRFRVKIADFGIARLVDGDPLTSTGVPIGTVAYMSPEQCRGERVDGHSDLYSLGVVLYEVVTGSLPFQINNFHEGVFKHLSAEPLSPRLVRPDLPQAVEEIILRCLAKKPEERFLSCATLAQVLAGLQSAEQITLPGSSPQPIVLRGSQTVISDRFGTSGMETLPAQAGAVYPNISSRGGHLVTQPVSSNVSLSIPEKSVKKSLRPGWIISAFFAVVLIAGGIFSYASGLISLGPKPGIIPTASPRFSTTTTVPSQNALDATATAQAYATATAQANATATAQKVAGNPYPPYAGTLALNDPLSDNSRGYGWEEGTRDQGTCTFVRGAYQSAIPLAAHFHSCLALSTNFSDFAYEVQMSLISASAGGIVFRADRSTTHLYYFTVDRTGGYLLKAYYDNVGDATVVASGSGIAFSDTEIIGIVVQGNTFSLYVNHQLIRQVQDGTFTQGQVGVVVYEGSGVFNNAKVWRL